MSHLLEEYAKNLGVKISLPIVSDHFFPLTCDKYITLSNDDEIESKHYPYYEVVINLLAPFLKQKEIKIVQLGGKSKIDGVDAALNLTFKQQSFILSKSLLHVGSDNVLNHLASAKQIPTVNIFGNTFPQINRPIYSSPSININLSPNWDKKPSFNKVDNKKQINNIKPELIAQSILDLLKIKGKKIDFKTLYAGPAFAQRLVEVVPSTFTPLQLSPNQTVVVRADYGFNIDAFIKYCKSYKVSVCSDKLIQPNGLQEIAANITDLLVFVDTSWDTIPENYLRLVEDLDINLVFLTKEKEDLGPIRNKYFDVPVRHAYPKAEPRCEVKEKTCFISHKRIVSEGKEYLSYAHLKKGLDKDNRVLDTPEYWRESDHFYIYESD